MSMRRRMCNAWARSRLAAAFTWRSGRSPAEGSHRLKRGSGGISGRPAYRPVVAQERFNARAARARAELARLALHGRDELGRRAPRGAARPRGASRAVRTWAARARAARHERAGVVHPRAAVAVCRIFSRRLRAGTGPARTHEVGSQMGAGGTEMLQEQIVPTGSMRCTAMACARETLRLILTKARRPDCRALAPSLVARTSTDPKQQPACELGLCRTAPVPQPQHMNLPNLRGSCSSASICYPGAVSRQGFVEEALHSPGRTEAAVMTWSASRGIRRRPRT